MSQNRLFLISIGCLFILLSSYMKTPLFLIVSGIALIVFALAGCKKNKAKKFRTSAAKKHFEVQ